MSDTNDLIMDAFWVISDVERDVTTEVEAGNAKDACESDGAGQFLSYLRGKNICSTTRSFT